MTNRSDEMNWTNIIGMIQKQGLSFLLLAAAVWWFSVENNDLRRRIDDCNSNMIENFKTDRENMIRVIEDNTHTMDRLIEKLQAEKPRR